MRRLPFLLAGLVFLAALTVFLPALDNSLVGWDDLAFLETNTRYRGLGPSQWVYAFTSFDHGLYHPLSWLSWGLDWVLWRGEDWGFYWTNILLHAANAVLFFFLGRRLLGDGEDAAWGAAFAALLFAVHPLRVESVAWAAQRRDVLSGLFYLLTIHFYLSRRLKAAFACFTLSLAAKAIGMTLPLALALLDVYPLKRLPANPRRWLEPKFRVVWTEKFPFAAAAAAAAALAGLAVHRYVAWEPFDSFGTASRLAQAFYALAFYLGKTLWPSGLLPLYEMPLDFGPFYPGVPAAAACVLGGGWLLWRLRRAAPALAAAGAFYILMLLPVLGLVKIQSHFAADRFTYLSCLGWALCAGEALRRFARGKGRAAVLAGAGVACVALGRLSWEQTKVWHDTGTLWRTVLAGNPDSLVARNNLASELARQGRLAEATELLREALARAPEFARAHANLGAALSLSGRPAEAAAHYREALRLNPRLGEARSQLGTVLTRLGLPAEAEIQYREALRRDARLVDARYNLGVLLLRLGRLDEARAELEKTVRLEPGRAQAWSNLGLCAQRRRLWAEAEAHYARALRAGPRLAEAHYNWAVVKARLGQVQAAERLLRAALRLEPDLLKAP